MASALDVRLMLERERERGLGASKTGPRGRAADLEAEDGRAPSQPRIGLGVAGDESDAISRWWPGVLVVRTRH